MQLDTEEGEFVPPAGVVASPTAETSQPAVEQPEGQGLGGEGTEGAVDATGQQEREEE
jgi:sorting nexin-1/2